MKGSLCASDFQLTVWLLCVVNISLSGVSACVFRSSETTEAFLFTVVQQVDTKLHLCTPKPRCV